MKKSLSCGIVWVLCLALFPAAVMAANKTDKSLPATIAWKFGLDSAFKVATDSNLRVIANFYTGWCKWCRVQDESTYTDERVIALQSRFVFARINAEIDTQLATKWGVKRFPTAVLFEKSGAELDRIVGYTPAETFVSTIEDYLNGVGTKTALEAASRENSLDWSLRYKIGEKFEGRGEYEQARSQYLQVVNGDPSNGSKYADKAMFALAVLDRNDRNWYKAIEGFRKFIKQYPKSKLREDAESYIPWLYAKAGDTKQALKFYKAFLKSYSGSSQVGWVKEQIKILENPADSSAS